jgi:hypothetical protein
MKRYVILLCIIMSIGILQIQGNITPDSSFKADFGGGNVVFSDVLDNLSFGQRIFFDIPAYDESLYDLIYISNNNYVLDMSLYDAYTVTSKQHITLHFAPKDYYLVLFTSEAGYIYDDELVLKNGYITQTPIVTDVKPNYQLISGDTYFYTKEGRSSKEVVNNHAIYVATYEKILNDTLSITSSNLTITNTSRESDIYFNDVLLITAPLQVDTLYFNYIYNDSNEIMSYHHNFYLTATHDMTLTAHYSEIIMDTLPFVYISDQIDIGLNQVALSAQFFDDTPSDVIEYGFIYGSDNTLSDPLTYTISRNHHKTSYHAYSKAFNNDIGYIKAYIIKEVVSEGVTSYVTHTSIIKKVIKTYVETFDTLGLSISSSTLQTGSFNGVISFSYQNVLSREMDGPAIVLVGNSGYLLSSEILPISSITFTYKKLVGARTGLKLNEVKASGEVTLHTIENITGEVTVTIYFDTPITQFKFLTVGTGYIAIDSITWRN